MVTLLAKQAYMPDYEDPNDEKTQTFLKRIKRGIKTSVARVAGITDLSQIIYRRCSLKPLAKTHTFCKLFFAMPYDLGTGYKEQIARLLSDLAKTNYFGDKSTVDPANIEVRGERKCVCAGGKPRS